MYSALRLGTSGLLLACYLVGLFRAEVGEQQFVIIQRVYSELRLETSGLLLSRGFIQS